MGEERETVKCGDEGRGCGVCPVAMLPDGVWRKLATPPFRKRHPVIFWLGCIALTLLALGAVNGLFFGSENETRDQLALISVSGPIMDPGPTLEWIRKVGDNPAVKGALVRIDSPGGGAAASQEIYAALARLAGKIPVVVSMGATAASGGLMAAMAGERIYANPSTITGSIGVRMDVPQLQGLLDKLGIGQETLTTSPYKDAISYLRPLTPEDRAYLQQVLQNMHEQFVEIVAAGRHMSLEEAGKLANGKIFTGQQALGLGLVDEMGGQEAAHAWLAQKTGVPQSRKLLVRQASKRRMLERLLGLAGVLAPGLESALNLAPGTPQPVFYY